MGGCAAEEKTASSLPVASMVSISSLAAGAGRDSSSGPKGTVGVAAVVLGSVIFSLAAASVFSSMVCGSITATVGRWPLPSHVALPSNIPRLFAAGVTFNAYSFASMPFGNCTRKHSMPIARSSSASDCAARSPASSRSYAM